MQNKETNNLIGMLHTWSVDKDDLDMIALDVEQNIVKSSFRLVTIIIEI